MRRNGVLRSVLWPLLALMLPLSPDGTATAITGEWLKAATHRVPRSEEPQEFRFGPLSPPGSGEPARWIRPGEGDPFHWIRRDQGAIRWLRPR